MMHKRAMSLPVLAVLVLGACEATLTGPADEAAVAYSTAVPGHRGDRIDADENGIPDEGVVVTGKYTSLYAYDGNGDDYWDLGDGRVQGTVDSPAELDAATLTTCHYQVQYRGAFENDPFLDTGWIMNNIRCRGYDDDDTYHYLIVHETDPRYRGDPAWAVWDEWEYHTLTVSGFGNLVRPITPPGRSP